jgi:exodeoxyribonuclease VII large subunit
MEGPQAYSVSDFIAALNDAFGQELFPAGVTVEGEVAEYRVSQNRWIWFRLKDGEATLECFATVWQLRSPLEDGMQVRVQARPKVHPKSGKFSLNVDRAAPVGEGALRRAFELLRRKLAEEGLFDERRKRELPPYPERIGLIASRESAAYSDFLRILGHRWSGLTVNSLHVQVQGQDAVQDICGAFRYFNEHPELADVIVLTRGGGSLEDLQAFNDEAVVRAVASSRVPVVCGIGHERDESLAEFAADLRASTPTHAAELVAPDRGETAALLASRLDRLDDAARRLTERYRDRLWRSVSSIQARVSGVTGGLRHGLERFERSAAMFVRSLPARRAASAGLARGLQRGFDRQRGRARERATQLEKLLRAADPRRPLALGYALVRQAGRLVRLRGGLRPGQELTVEFRDGQVAAEVKHLID